jgi:hypothetical protein
LNNAGGFCWSDLVCVVDENGRRIFAGDNGTLSLMWRSNVSRGSTSGPSKNRGNTAMSKKAAEHHKHSAEHHTLAARHHGEAAKHHDGGHHEKAAHHAHTAMGHALHAQHHSDEAAKYHMEEHGKK